MTAALDLDRLRKVCGLLGSEHHGERAAAGLRATSMLRAAGKSWSDIEVGVTSRITIMEAHDAAAMAAIYKMSLDSERARTTHMAEELTRLKREVARLKGMWPKVPA